MAGPRFHKAGPGFEPIDCSAEIGPVSAARFRRPWATLSGSHGNGQEPAQDVSLFRAELLGIVTGARCRKLASNILGRPATGGRDAGHGQQILHESTGFLRIGPLKRIQHAE